MSSQRVEFLATDGVTLRGDFYPTPGDKSPIVIMTQGLTLLKEHYLPDWAARFQKASISALIYDHRGWGSSGGTQRNAVDPLQQAEDYHDAVLFAQSLPSVDPSRIAIWGIGHAGGASMIAAGEDPNIKAVVLVMPWISGAFDAAACPEGALQRAWEERRDKVQGKGGEGGFVQVWDESKEEAKGPRNGVWLHGPMPWRFIEGAKKRSDVAGTPWENRLTLESVYRITKVEPRDYIGKIAPRPLLYLAASEDPLSGPFEEQQKVFEAAAGDNKEFVRLEGEHIDHYFGKFDRCIEIQIEWLRRNL